MVICHSATASASSIQMSAHWMASPRSHPSVDAVRYPNAGPMMSDTNAVWRLTARLSAPFSASCRARMRAAGVVPLRPARNDLHPAAWAADDDASAKALTPVATLNRTAASCSGASTASIHVSSGKPGISYSGFQYRMGLMAQFPAYTSGRMSFTTHTPLRARATYVSMSEEVVALRGVR